MCVGDVSCVRARMCVCACACVRVCEDCVHGTIGLTSHGHFWGGFFFCGAQADPFNATARKRRVCVQKASGAPDDMTAAARCMNEYLDMFPQAQVLKSTLLMSIYMCIILYYVSISVCFLRHKFSKVPSFMDFVS